MIRLVLLAVIVLWVGCDCLQSVTGTVVDQSGTPIEGAEVTEVGDENVKDITDSDGKFELADVTGRNSCERMELSVTRTGYTPLSVTVDNESDVTIILTQ
jgi:hypothetical protein